MAVSLIRLLIRLILDQELECAVSVEEDNRQEWTFTLYDFDNNGKVTREVRVLLKSINTHIDSRTHILHLKVTFLLRTHTHNFHDVLPLSGESIVTLLYMYLSTGILQ